MALPRPPYLTSPRADEESPHCRLLLPNLSFLQTDLSQNIAVWMHVQAWVSDVIVGETRQFLVSQPREWRRRDCSSADRPPPPCLHYRREFSVSGGWEEGENLPRLFVFYFCLQPRHGARGKKAQDGLPSYLNFSAVRQDGDVFLDYIFSNQNTHLKTAQMCMPLTVTAKNPVPVPTSLEVFICMLRYKIK